MTSPTPTVRPLGPGVLSVGSAGSLIDFSTRVTSAKIAWGVKTEDDVPVLSGGTEAGDRTYTATLEANVYQDDLVDGSLTRFTWEHRGEQLPFTFTPFGNDIAITGDVIVDPVDIGGDVKKKNRSDIKWGCVGTPELADDLS